jgi:hypothetical protein
LWFQCLEKGDVVDLLRKFLAFFLVAALAFPAWGESSGVVGVAVDSSRTTVRGLPLAAGSTLFSGDDVSVDKKGDAKIALSGGGQVELLGNSAAMLTRAQTAVQMLLQRGSATFHSVPGSPVEALMADATIRAQGGRSAVALITMESADSAVVVAQKSALEIATAHDAGTLRVPEGSAARITLTSEQDAGQNGQNGGQGTTPPAPAGKRHKKRFALVVLLVGGGLTTAGLILAHREPQVTNVISEVSPFQLQQH